MISPKITPINDPILTCFERPLFAVATWLQREHQLASLASFYFSGNYVKDYTNISQVTDLSDLLKMYIWATRINVTTHDHVDFDQAYSIFSKQLDSNYPIMTFIDSYNCPWYPSYKKSHIKHYVLIVGINFEKCEFLCIDKYNDVSNNIVSLPFEDFSNGSGEFCLFEKLSNCLHTKKSVISKTVMHLENITTSDKIFNSIIDFRKKLLDDFSMEMELSQVHNYKVAPIYTWLKGIANSRLKYKSALLYCQEKYNVFISPSVYSALDVSYKKWWKVLLLLIKAKDSAYPVNEYIVAAKTIDTIIDYEKELTNEILTKIR